MTDIAERHWNPWTAIWLHPRQSMQELVLKHRFSTLLILALLSGIAQTLDQASLENIADKIPENFHPGLVLLGIILVGMLMGIVGLFAFSFALHISGKWFGGKAPLQHLWVAVAWASVPTAVALFLWIPEWLLFGPELFSANTPRLDASEGLTIALICFALTELTLMVWSLVLLVATVAEVQALSIGRTLVTLVLSFIFMCLLIIPVGALLGTLTAMITT